MFGYVRPVKEELKVRDYDRYRAAYCGVCRALGREYGFLSRFFVNYDMTFLYLLLASVEAPCAQRRCHCPARFGCRKPCLDDTELLGYVAAVDVILCRHKLDDNVLDHGFFSGLPYRIVRGLTAHSYRKAKKRLPDFDGIVAGQLEKLHQLEQARSDSLDATADAFAAILRACAVRFDDPALRRPTEQLLYHVGRYIYLADALDDLNEDCARDRYNPLRYRFHPVEGHLEDADAAYLRELLDASVNLAGAALALLPSRSGGEILENILFLGLPIVIRAIENGSFRGSVKL